MDALKLEHWLAIFSLVVAIAMPFVQVLLQRKLEQSARSAPTESPPKARRYHLVRRFSAWGAVLAGLWALTAEMSSAQPIDRWSVLRLCLLVIAICANVVLNHFAARLIDEIYGSDTLNLRGTLARRFAAQDRINEEAFRLLQALANAKPRDSDRMVDITAPERSDEA